MFKKRKAQLESFSYPQNESNKRLLTERIAADMGVLRIDDPCHYHGYSFVPTTPDMVTQPTVPMQNYYQQSHPYDSLFHPSNVSPFTNTQFIPPNTQYISPPFTQPFIPTNTQQFTPPLPQQSAPPYPSYPSPSYPSYSSYPSSWPMTQPAQQTVPQEQEENKNKAIMIYTGPSTEKKEDEQDLKYSLHLPASDKRNDYVHPEFPIPLHSEDLSKALILYTSPRVIIEDSILRNQKEEKEKINAANEMQDVMIYDQDFNSIMDLEQGNVPSNDLLSDNEVCLMSM